MAATTFTEGSCLSGKCCLVETPGSGTFRDEKVREWERVLTVQNGDWQCMPTSETRSARAN